MKEDLKDITVITVCPMCGTETHITVSASDYLDYLGGKLVQDAFPYLSADERESFISGICPTCWDKMFSEEEEDESDDCDYEVGYDLYMGCFTDDC